MIGSQNIKLIDAEHHQQIILIVKNLCQQFLMSERFRIGRLEQQVQSLNETVERISNELEDIKRQKNSSKSSCQPTLRKIDKDYFSYEGLFKYHSNVLDKEELNPYSSILQKQYLDGNNSDRNLDQSESQHEEWSFQASSIQIKESWLKLNNSSLIEPPEDYTNSQFANSKIDQQDASKLYLKNQEKIPKKGKPLKNKSKVSKYNFNQKNLKKSQSKNSNFSNTITKESLNESSSLNLKELNPKNYFLNEIQRVTNNFQICDLTLNSFIQCGFLLFGKSKIGKTSIGYLLSKNRLLGKMSSSGYVIDSGISQEGKWIIGHSDKPSTTTPNKFKVQLQQLPKSKFAKKKVGTKQMSIIDSPCDCSDQKEVLEIISNGYFNYRIFSKIQKIKFVLCFDMTKFGRDTFETISKFIKTFYNFEKIKEQIFCSSCFLFNKVQQKQGKQNDSNAVINDIKQKLRKLKENDYNFECPEDHFVAEFITQMIKENKIYTIKCFTKGDNLNDHQSLRKINQQVTEWFQRKVDCQKNEVDMKDIRVNVSKQVIQAVFESESEKNKLRDLIKFQNDKIHKFFGESKGDPQQFQLQLIINQLIYNTISQQKSFSFVNVIDNCNDQLTKFRLPNQKRSKQEKRLFEQNNSQSENKQKIKNFTVKKFMTLEKIYKLIEQQNCFQGSETQWVEECQKKMYQIVKTLQISMYFVHEKKVIIRYSYELFRLFQETKILNMLMDNLPNQNEHPMNVIFGPDGMVINLFEALKSFINRFIKQDGKNVSPIKDLKMLYIKQFDIQKEQNKNMEYLEDLIDFFIEANAPQQTKQPIKQKIVNIIVKYAKRNLNDSKYMIPSQTLCRRFLKNFTIGMAYCKDLWKKYQDQDKTNQLILIMLKLGRFLGQALQFHKKYQLSRQVYDSVRCIHKVSKLYRLEIAELRSHSKSIASISIAYAEYLSENLKEDESRAILQQAYQVVDSLEDFQSIKDQLNDFNVLISSEEGMFHHERFGKLEDTFIDELQKAFPVDDPKQVKQSKQMKYKMKKLQKRQNNYHA